MADIPMKLPQNEPKDYEKYDVLRDKINDILDYLSEQKSEDYENK